MFESLFTTLVVTIATTLLGLFTSLLQRRRTREVEQLRQETDRLASAYEKELAARKAAALESVVEKLPTGLAERDVTRLVDELAKRLPTPAEPAPASPVESLINSYHEQALGQAKAQFWFSIVAATAGFVWILVFGAQIQPSDISSVGTILPGVVMDAVAFLFFRQAAETRQRATDLYDRLRRDKQASESIALVTSIEDERIRSTVKAQIALHMSGLTPSPIDISAFLSGRRAPDNV